MTAGASRFPLFPLLVIGLIGLVIFATRDQRRQAPTATSHPRPGAAPPAAARSHPGRIHHERHRHPRRPGAHESGHQSAAPSDAEPAAAAAWMPPPRPAFVPPPPRPRRTGLVLFWPTLALIAIGLGSLGIFDIENSRHPLGVRRPGRHRHRGDAPGRRVRRPARRPDRAGTRLSRSACSSTSIVGPRPDGHRATNRELLVRPSNPAALADSYRVPNGSILLDLSRMRDARRARRPRPRRAASTPGRSPSSVPEGSTPTSTPTSSYAGDISIGDVTPRRLRPVAQPAPSHGLDRPGRPDPRPRPRRPRRPDHRRENSRIPTARPARRPVQCQISTSQPPPDRQRQDPPPRLRPALPRRRRRLGPRASVT